MPKYDFQGVSVLVVGDVMLDKYYFGSVRRISPEAPVPVVKVVDTKLTLGGAGNVLSNVSHLGAKGIMLSTCGKDENAVTLKGLLNELKAECSFIERDLPTVTKLRVVGEKQQIVRLDFEEIVPVVLTEEYKEIIDKSADEADIIVLSDYGKGVCTDEMCRFVIETARKYGKKVIVDPKGSDWTKYKGANIVTPNVNELGEAALRNVSNNDEDITLAATSIIEKYGIDCLLVTRSHKGMSIITKDSAQHIPTEAQEVFDVSGAGDTVVATLAVGLGKGFTMEEASITANKAAGIVVSKIGTTPVYINELNSIGASHSATSREEIVRIAENLRRAGKRIVFTNGCFDILHKGHVTYLREARKLGDVLILGLNTDESVRGLKGDGRPVNNEDDRAEVLCSLESVDYVVKFGESTPLELIKSISPDVLVKGGDYKLEEVVGREYAGQTALINFVDGYSTTAVIKKLNGTN
jgi:D-beta-D-heptose 7-phosphate kinase/D-beta-D-heptose 1-phosphate adenosyltransferase